MIFQRDENSCVPRSGPQFQPSLDVASQQACHADFNLKQSLFRIGDDCIYER